MIKKMSYVYFEILAQGLCVATGHINFSGLTLCYNTMRYTEYKINKRVVRNLKNILPIKQLLLFGGSNEWCQIHINIVN